MIFILDKKERVINVLKNNKVATSKKSYFDDLLYEDLDTGASTFSVSTNAYNEVSQYLIVGNYVAFKDKKGNYRLFQITNVETEHNESMTITIYSECAGLSLINNVFRKRKMTSVTIRKFVDAITENTDWSTGFIEDTINTSLDLDIPDGSCYSTLQTYIKKFGVEIEFRVELNNGRISKKYIDVYRQRGRATGKRFTYGRDIEKIVKTSDSSELYTALIGRGKNDVTFRDVTVEGIDKPLGQDFVADKSSFERFNRNGYHLTGIYSVDSDSPEVVLRETYKKLQEVKEPKISYEIPVVLLGELLGIEYDKVSIGDQIGILDTDFNPPLMLSARVSKLYVSETNNDNTKCVLSNFKEVSSSITEEMKKIASELEGYVDKKFPIGSSDIQEEAVNGSHMDKQYVTQITADIVKASVVEAEKVIAEEIEAVEGKFERLEADYGDFKQITTDKINAVEGNFDTINSDLGNFKEVTTDKITAVEGNFNKINADLIETNKIVANLGKFDDVIAERVDAVEGNFTELEAEVGKINTLVSGNITSDNIHSSGISSDKLTIRDGFIKNAMIDSVNASKINAGEINTNKVHITSANGGIVIADNTQQFKDKNGKVRIQMGQDASGNFNFGVFDATGSGTLIDATGVKEKALADGIIKDRMIGQGEIGGNKINISSMIEEVNKESNTKTIKGSKVQLDTQGQTLEVAFNKLKTTVNDTSEKTESNTTSLNAQQGKIDTLIQDTTIEKNGQSLKLKDEYSKLEQTVGGISSTVGSHTTSISTLGGKIDTANSNISKLDGKVTTANNNISNISGKVTEVESKQATFKQDLDGFKQTVSNTYTTKTELSNTNKKVEGLTTTVENVSGSLETTKTQVAGIVTNLDSITQRVSSTETNVESVIETSNTALSTANQNKADIGKKANATDVYKKSETYTKNQTDSAITTAKNEITLGVSQTYETKSNVESKISSANTTTLNSAKSYADTKKNEAISTASTDAANKVNSAKNELNTKIDNIQVGGRNLIKNSNKRLNSKTPTNVQLGGVVDYQKLKGKTVTLSMDINVSDMTNVSGQQGRVGFEFSITHTDDTSTYIGVWHWVSEGNYNGRKIKTITVPNKDIKSLNYNGLYMQCNATSCDMGNVKLEEGNKATSWTPAPEDIDSALGTKANSSDVYTKSEVFTKEETNSQITATTNAITSRVSSLESTTSSLNGTVTNHENRLKTAENKITDSAIINTVSSTIQNAKNEAINSANSSTDNKLQNYATNSSLTQTANDITAKFTSTGGYNLLKNSDAKNGTSFWVDNGGGLSVSTGGAAPFIGEKEFKTSFPSGMRYYESIKLKPSTEYVYEAWVYCQNTFSGTSNTPLHFWCNTTANTAGRSQCTVLDYRQSLTAGAYEKLYVHFKTKTGDVYFTPFIYYGGQTGSVAVKQISLTENKVESAWTQHPSEIYEGSTVIDASGVTVNNGALRVKDNSGNIMLEGDTSGTLYLRKQLKVGTVGTFSPSGINITGGSFTVSGGTVYNDSSGGYSEGSTTSQSLYDNGLRGSSSKTTGSQIHRSDSFYGSNGWSIYEDNSSNALQQSYKTYSRGSGIYIQATDSDKGGTGSFVEATRLNHEGLITTGSITASKGVTVGGQITTPSSGALKDAGGNIFLRNNNSGSTILSNKSGTLYFRPKGDTSAENQTTLDSSGLLTVNGGATIKGSAGLYVSGAVNGSNIRAGGATRVTSLNGRLVSGWYSWTSGCTGAPTTYGIVLNIQWTESGDIYQLAIGSSGQLWTRVFLNGAWGSWNLK